MSGSIALAQLKELLADGAQLVDVLPPEEYAAEHLPSSIEDLAYAHRIGRLRSFYLRVAPELEPYLVAALGTRSAAPAFTSQERHHRRARDAYSPEAVDRAAISVPPSQRADAA